jgi:nicotinamide-nucleotide amidase
MGLLPQDLYDAAEETIALCRAKSCVLVTAESCTGGLIGAALTSVEGASEVFHASYVTYANAAKEITLGVAPSLIRAEGAVSEKVAFAMARGALEQSPASIAVAVTGIAGPGGGSSEKPVGTVHIAAVSSEGKTLHQVQLFSGDRDAVRLQTALYALKMVRQLAADEDF